MKEVIEMTQTLLEMGTDTYMECKYMFLSLGQGCKNARAFYEMLFEMTDRKRPLLIETKKDGTA